MGSRVTKTAHVLIDECRYDLRDGTGTQWSDSELLAYLNRGLEMVHDLLVDHRSERLLETETIATAAGTETYALASNDMGDFVAPHSVWIAGNAPMSHTDEHRRLEYQLAGGDMQTGVPDLFYIAGDDIGFLPAPNDVYTVNVRYWPQFAGIAAGATLPHQNLFNLQLREAVKMMAKHRETYNTGLETALQGMFQARALEILRMRRPRTYRWSPG
jgi:hypothetical protein